MRLCTCIFFFLGARPGSVSAIEPVEEMPSYESLFKETLPTLRSRIAALQVIKTGCENLENGEQIEEQTIQNSNDALAAYQALIQQGRHVNPASNFDQAVTFAQLTKLVGEVGATAKNRKELLESGKQILCRKKIIEDVIQNTRKSKQGLLTSKQSRIKQQEAIQKRNKLLQAEAEKKRKSVGGMAAKGVFKAELRHHPALACHSFGSFLSDLASGVVKAEEPYVVNSFSFQAQADLMKATLSSFKSRFEKSKDATEKGRGYLILSEKLAAALRADLMVASPPVCKIEDANLKQFFDDNTKAITVYGYVNNFTSVGREPLALPSLRSARGGMRHVAIVAFGDLFSYFQSVSPQGKEVKYDQVADFFRTRCLIQMLSTCLRKIAKSSQGLWTMTMCSLFLLASWLLRRCPKKALWAFAQVLHPSAVQQA